ncbi:hypothetical protein ELZ30_08470 [Enterococcus faecium]|nr:hypothetical protein DPR13_12935 [Enterococcus faecium]MCD9223478.1 hypothetical protein [Enterococcus lactis]RIX95251.1 hypothetical protein D3Y30_03970 [Enterococcus faecium TX1330]EGP0011654.1 hypothetical protein [Enterococcus faecium]EGP4719843.1 hypothetical protein [Enterococcus faecium]
MISAFEKEKLLILFEQNITNELKTNYVIHELETT